MNYLEGKNKDQLFSSYSKVVTGDNSMPEVETPKIGHHITFQWKDYDRATLDQIKNASRRVSNEILGELLSTVDYFYSTFRKPRLNQHNIPMMDGEGRIVWDVDSNGRYIDDFGSLTGQDVEEAILKIQRDKIDAAQQINDLFLEALFAKHLFDDEFQERYESLLDGTIADRTARATRDTKQAKYFAYFRFHVYQQSDVLFSEVGNLLRLLERVRQWRVSDRFGSSDGRSNF